MVNPLAKRHTMGSLFRFALPNMIMMLFSSMYVIVDGIFVSRFLGTVALSAVNMVYPLISLQLGVGIMIAAGGSAIIARRLGEGKEQEARSYFTLFLLASFVVGLLMAVLGVAFLDQILAILGVSELQFELCRTYEMILFIFSPFFMLQTVFQIFFVTAGKPVTGLTVIVAAGLSNMVLDYLLMGPMKMGIAGAAIATGIGYCIPAAAGVLIFAGSKGGQGLFFVRPRFHGAVFCQACANGASEMVTNLANAVTTFLFNFTFLRYWGEDGVASITIVLYFQYVFTAIHFGYSNGVAPIISFQYGRRDQVQLRNVIRHSLWFVALCSAAAFMIAQLTAGWVVSVFTERGGAVYSLTVDGMRWYAVAFLLMGVSIFTSALFTALSDGKTSAIISFARTFLFLIAMILLLPRLMGEVGVWLAVPAAEGLGILVSAVYLIKGIGDGSGEKQRHPQEEMGAL